MPNYNLSTINRIGDITRGVQVKTSVLANTVALLSGTVSIFNVYGRIRIVGLNCEAITAFAADATLLKWRFTSTTPSVGISDISGASLSIASLVIGGRVMWRGGAVAAVPDVNQPAQASVAVVEDWMDVGHTGGVGVISAVSSIAAQTSGTCQFNLYYFPISDGAYAEAAV
jgi:hypothetical protein